MSSEDRPKLKVLCLHGFNNNGAIMKYQMRNIIKQYEDYIDFTFLDGPFSSVDRPLAPFVKLGFKG